MPFAAILPFLPAIASGISSLIGGRSKGRQEEANAAREYDRAEIARAHAITERALAENQQRKFIADEQQRQYGNLFSAGLMQGAQDVSFEGLPDRIRSRIPTLSGAKPSLIANRDEISNQMYRTAMTDLLNPMTPGTAAPGPNRMAELPMPPAVSSTPSAGKFDQALGWIGTGLGAYGIYDEARRGRAPTASPGLTPEQQQTRVTLPNNLYGPPTSAPASAQGLPAISPFISPSQFANFYGSDPNARQLPRRVPPGVRF